MKTPKGTELPILVLKGKDYLEVKYRLVWFREERPLWSIETEFISVTDKSATAKAIIKDEAGRIISTSHKFENMQGFPDFLEKAETGSIGRALALIGYGTQFCGDELDEKDRIVDAPVDRKEGLTHTGPLEEMGNTEPLQYTISFGKWRQRTLEQVYGEHGEQGISGYISFLEDSSKKKGVEMSDLAKEFITHAERFLAVVENRQARAIRGMDQD